MSPANKPALSRVEGSPITFRDMEQLKNFSSQHPKIVSWIALAFGMVVILLWSAKDVGLLPAQTLALVIATIVLAGLCVWIIGWEDGEDESKSDSPPESKS